MSKNNPQTQAAYMAVRRADFRSRIRLLKSNPCTDCGGSFHYSAMDFDHPEDNKSFEIADFGGSSWDKIQTEIDKCELVCSNCHRVRTWKRKMSLTSTMDVQDGPNVEAAGSTPA